MQLSADKQRCAVFVFSEADAAKRRKKTQRADSAIEFDCLAASADSSNLCVSCETPMISGDLSLTTLGNETKHWRCVSNEELAMIQATSQLDRFDALPAVSKFIIYRAFVRGSTEAFSNFSFQETRHSVTSPLQQHRESNIPANPVFVSLKKSRKQHELPPTTHFPHWLGGDAPTACDTPSEATGLSDRPFDITEAHSVYPFMMSISEPLCARVVKRLEDAKKARVLAQMLPASFVGSATVKAMACNEDNQCEDEKPCCSTSDISSLSDVSDSDMEMADNWDADSELTDLSFSSSISSASARQQPKAFSSKSRRFSPTAAAEKDLDFDTESVLTELSYQSSEASDTCQAAVATTASAYFPTSNVNPPLWQFRINLSDRKPPLLVASSPPEHDDDTISVLTDLSHCVSESESEIDHALHKNDTRYAKQLGFSNKPRNTNAGLAASAAAAATLGNFNKEHRAGCSTKSTMKRKREDWCNDCGVLFSRPDALKRHIVKNRCREKKKRMSRESTETILVEEL
ncbi:hypothetical protein HDU81_000150 [Chytriomyces hyalinus]|nr:hypothetical protein HDU81_000150 [Chytriomyces hyalinus]